MKDNNLEKIFLKDKYSKFNNNKFNIWIFIFSYIYLFYRKLYILGTIILLIHILLNYFKLYFIIGIINIILGLIFNKLYLTIIKQKIEEYKIDFMDNKLVKKECQKENTNLPLSIIIGTISMCLMLIPYINIKNQTSRLEELYYKIDKPWIKSSYSNKYYYNYSYEDIENDCTLTIELIKSGNDYEFLNTILDSYNSDSNINDIYLNNYPAKMVNINQENYIYTINHNNNLYILLFNIYKDNGICNSYHNNIINSIKFRK